MRFGFIAPLVAIAVALMVPTISEAQAVAEPAQPKSETELRRKSLRDAVLLTKEAMDGAVSEIQVELDALNSKSVSDIAYEDVFRMLHMQKAELSIEIEGLAARLQMLKKHAEEIGSSESRNEVSRTQQKLLERHVANQSQFLSRIRSLFENGEADSNSVKEAEDNLMEAELRLKQFNAKRETKSPALANAIFETSLSIADSKARIAKVNRMIDAYDASRQSFMKLKDLREKRDKLSHDLGEYQLQLWSVERRSEKY